MKHVCRYEMVNECISKVWNLNVFESTFKFHICSQEWGILLHLHCRWKNANAKANVRWMSWFLGTIKNYPPIPAIFFHKIWPSKSTFQKSPKLTNNGPDTSKLFGTMHVRLNTINNILWLVWIGCHLELFNAICINIIMEAKFDKHDQCRGYALNI